MEMIDGRSCSDRGPAQTTAESVFAELTQDVSALRQDADIRRTTAPEIYLDANATVAPLSEVADTVMGVFADGAANASSAHSRGAAARFRIQKACDEIALLVDGLLPENIVFTATGTEANNVVMAGVPWSIETTLVVGASEHSSVLKTAQAAARLRSVDLRVVPIDRAGRLDEGRLVDAVRDARSNLLVSLQWANSETGVVQPIPRLAAAIRMLRPDAVVHADAAQALGRIPISIGPDIRVDALTISGHKIHAPQGIGAVLLADPDRFAPGQILFGGDQQRRLRPGTEPVHLIAGLGTAARIRADNFERDVEKLGRLRDAFEQRVLAQVRGTTVNGGKSARLPNTSNIRFADVDGTALIANLDEKGIFCSQASACSSARPEPSHVLTAMGLTEQEAYGSVRFAASVLNTVEEMVRAADVVTDTVALLRHKETAW